MDSGHELVVTALSQAWSNGDAKSGGGALRLNLDEALVISPKTDPTSVKMNDALTQLATFDQRKARVVEMRYFGGLNANDVASVLGVSLQTVKRDCSLAKAWLARELTSGESTSGVAGGTSRI